MLPETRTHGKENFAMQEQRQLSDLDSVGPSMLRDFERLGIRSVAGLARRNPKSLYEELCRATGQAQDLCVLDVFTAAVAQARNRRLPAPQRQWWYWSRRRKAAERAQAGRARRG
jgi:hypothetical protein